MDLKQNVAKICRRIFPRPHSKQQTTHFIELIYSVDETVSVFDPMSFYLFRMNKQMDWDSVNKMPNQYELFFSSIFHLV